MKINNKIFGWMGALGLLLAGCSTDGDLSSDFHSDTHAVRITAQVGKASVDGFSRSNPLGATADEQKKFNEGDEISVSADGQGAVTYKLAGNEWQPQGGNFLKWESETMNFTAYYPATFNGTVTQPTEYNSVESLAASDFMSCRAESQSKPQDNKLSLTMERQMARVVVEVVKFNNQYADGTLINSVTINGNVKAFKHEEDGKFYALIKPCEAQAAQEFLSLKVGDDNNVETLKGIPALEAGKSYTYQLTVGKNMIEVNGITVADWESGEVLDGKSTSIPYVGFSADDTQTFKMTTYGNYTITDLEYAVGENVWKPVVANQEVEFGGDKGSLFLRGKNLNGTASSSPYNYSTITFANSNVKVACTGDIRTLLDWEKYKNVDTKDARFYCLFENCRVLTSAPDLPATALANYCYYYMFQGCSSLKTAPELPANTLAYSCYKGMFQGCSSLKTAPALPATTLEDDCYNSMFQSCSSLESAPALPATKMASQCYTSMFQGCSSLKTAPALPATELDMNCYSGMFFNCENLTTAPELLATTLFHDCYDQMFNNCIKLSSITILAPNTEISKVSLNVRSSKWLENAGTDASVTSRTLKVKDKDAYQALVDKSIDENWKIGKCTVLDENGNEIVEDSGTE